jgi:hypothetical protein
MTITTEPGWPCFQIRSMRLGNLARSLAEMFDLLHKIGHLANKIVLESSRCGGMDAKKDRQSRERGCRSDV